MNNKKQQHFPYFPLQQLHKIVQHQTFSNKKINNKKLLPSKAIIKNHSKSLYYYNSQNRNIKPVSVSILNSTAANNILHNINKQTLNEELLGIQRQKPHTSQYRSGRGANVQSNYRNLMSNKISLRNSSNYNKLSSVAGIQLNEKQAQSRMESYINAQNNVRKNKNKQIQKQNKKIAERLSSQQSQYSTKQILKEYESQQRISKRLTQSKVSKRSNRSIDNRSICSEHSSRASVISGSSRNSNSSSMKSTSRVNSSNSSSRNQGNRFQSKFQPAKKIKIIQHNINKMNQDELTKFKSLFANSFTTKSNRKVLTQNVNQLYHKNILNNNPYVDVEVLSQKSQTSIKKQKTPQKETYVYSINNSNRKLKQLSFDIQLNNKTNEQKIYKKTSAITSDGLLHRIAQEMYQTQKNGSTDNLIYRMGRHKKASNSTTKATNPEVKNEKIMNGVLRSNNKKKIIKDQLKNSIFPNPQIFSGKF